MLLTFLSLLPFIVASPLHGRQVGGASTATGTSEAETAAPTAKVCSSKGTGGAATTSAPSNTASPPAAASASASASVSDSATGPVVTFYPEGDPVYVEGIAEPQFNQNVYLGVPFAQPPVGDLRFTAPQPANYNSTVVATAQPPACLQNPTSSSATYGISEDCLYLDIYQPGTASDSSDPIPVFVWVYGGSFDSGAASTYNATAILAQGAQTGKPVIFVALNYRLGIFGFGNGKEIAANGAANLGIRDVIHGLEWVQANIWAWGGDPSRVTLAGQSAGAIITSLLYLNPGQWLFNNAIMESGAQATAPIEETQILWQAPYDIIANLTHCASTPDSFQCLKQLPAEALLNASLAVKDNIRYSGSFIFCPSIDGDLIPGNPYDLLQDGQFAYIPYISGNNEDEGTAFLPPTTNFSTLPLVFDFAEPTGLSANLTKDLLALYPDAAAGAPFGTGNETFGLSPAFKIGAAVLGDSQFQSLRRYFLESSIANGLDQAWSYLFTGLNPNAAPYLGSYHGVEIPYVFGSVSTAQNYTEVDVQLSQQMIEYWLNFVYYSDPNGQADSNATYWPSYGANQTMIQLNSTNTTLITDTYRETQIDFSLSHPGPFNYKRAL